MVFALWVVSVCPFRSGFGQAPLIYFVGAGVIIGPTIGTALWRLQYRRLLPLIDAKDHLFFQRVAKNRVDATLQSPTNPVPDYYGEFIVDLPCHFQAKSFLGEKIGSLHEYRTVSRFLAFYFIRLLILYMPQWLRDQAKYKRKALLPEKL